MANTINRKKVNRYISIDKKLDVLKVEYEALKTYFRGLHEKGYTSPLLEFIDKTQQKIDWKKELDRITRKCMKPGERKVYYSRLNKRYPRKPVAATIQIVGKERKKHGDSKESSAHSS